MIKFFRRIRKQLLTENLPAGRTGKFNKYFFYAIGEILLVVIGILIAVQINKAYNDQGNRNLERFYLDGIVQDIKVDIDRLNENIILDSIKVRSGNFILDHFKNPTKKKDSILLTHFSNTSPITGFEPNDIVFGGIKSSGRLNIISHDSLRNNIQRYYSHGTRIADVLDENNKIHIEIYAQHLYNGQYNMNSIISALSITYAGSEGMPVVTPFDSKLFYTSKDELETKAFIDRLSMSIILSELNVRRLIIGKENAYALIDDINEYLETIK